MKFKFTFRTTLLTILATLLVVTVVALITSSHYYASRSASDLLSRLMQETSRRIYNRVDRLIDTAADQVRLNERLMETEVFPADDFPALAKYWIDVMDVSPELSFLTFTLEDSGETIGVARLHDGRLYVQEYRRSSETDSLEPKGCFAEDYPHGLEAYDAEFPDQRLQPWYLAAQKVGGRIWTPTYIWSWTYVVEGKKRRFGAFGVTCATPVFRSDGSLAGVLTVDFNTYDLCRYLEKLHVGDRGFAFLVELRDDGSHPVIAHPQWPDLLTDLMEQNGKAELEQELARVGDDDRIRQFMGQLPATIEPDAEAQFRPVSFTFEGDRYVGGYRYVTGEDTPEWLICILLPEDEVMGLVWRNNLISTSLGAVILLVAGLISVYVSRQVAKPLERLAIETEAIGKLHVEARPPNRSLVLEVDRLGLAMEEMKTSLRSFQKYVPSELVRSLLASNREARPEGERKTMTMFFSDIANFTQISENLPPEELVEQLSEYLSESSARILQTGGTVDKYIGDAIMAFWGAPADHPQHAAAACTAAVQCQHALRQMRIEWSAAGKPAIYSRIGLHTGEVVVGNIGSDARLSYTVIGDAVNLASRLEELNKHYGTEILISESTYQQAREFVVARPLDWVAVKGKTESVLIYELLGLRGEVAPTAEELAELATQVLASYRRQDWSQATRLLEQILEQNPDDQPTQRMLVRCRHYQSAPPGDDWDGVHRLSTK